MDLEILFWLLFLLAPVISRWLQGKKKGQQRKPQPQPAHREPVKRRPPSEAESTPRLSPFEEALRQIQEALEGTQEPEPVEVPRPEKAIPKVREPRTFSNEPVILQEDRFERAPARFESTPARFDRFEDRRSFFDEDFESEPAFEEPFHETVHSHLDSGEDDIPKRPARPKAKRSKWQEAFVMSEVLMNPRYRSRWAPRSSHRRES